ncbi:Hypothetical protein HDN1F_28650 [gamma proteobacterium HdN1]|nr:Hypothetical protein HDN1F_28650 [gamma proteobacterium HdN1]
MRVGPKTTLFRQASSARWIAVVWALAFVLVGCTSSPYEPRALQGVAGDAFYTVGKGDTLYSIAAHYGLSHKELARLNGISDPRKIHVGQKIRVRKSTGPNNNSRIFTKNNVKSSVGGKQQANQKGNKNAPEYSKRVQGKVANGNTGAVAWVWPTRGTIVERFSEHGNVNKGIDLGGRLGEPVFAAASGVVAYSGSGIVGYGNLIIIKHNDVYLSAYAHNSRLLVAEGNNVKAGQKIAEIGSTGAQGNRLHFEIRRYGRPVDPLGYLPKR